MMHHRRLVSSVLAVFLIVSMLILPMAASAGGASNQQGLMYVPPFAQQAYTLTVGRVGVTIPPGAMPLGGFVYLNVLETPSGRFKAEFLPDREFPVQVEMDFDSAPWIDYQSKKGPVRIWTNQGKIDSSHFSRYSGWF
mgnify:CR=1 FL=1